MLTVVGAGGKGGKDKGIEGGKEGEGFRLLISLYEA